MTRIRSVVAATLSLFMLGGGMSAVAARAAPVQVAAPASTDQDAGGADATAALTLALPVMKVVMQTKPAIIVQGARSKLVATLTKNGKPFAGQKMSLWQRPSAAGSQWQRVGTISTNDDGNAIYKVKPAVNMRYQARFAERAQYRAAESNSAQVSVRAPIVKIPSWLSANYEDPILTFAGTTSPLAAGARARIQCRESAGPVPGPYETVGYGLIGSNGTYNATFVYEYGFLEGECRAFIPSTKWLSSNWSAPVEVGLFIV